jgi:fermentation-respiration switch protein FrsA (DUF1100 family)
VSAGLFAEAPEGLRSVLVIHGDRDEIVPVAHARLLFDRACDPRALHLLAGADHRLSDPGHRLEAVSLSREWLLAHLG